MDIWIVFALVNLGLGLLFQSMGQISFPQFAIATFFLIMALFNIGG